MIDAKTAQPIAKIEEFAILVTATNVFVLLAMVEDSTPRVDYYVIFPDKNRNNQWKTVTATQTYQNLTITLGKEGKDEQEEFEQCFFWIASPSNTQLEVRVAGLNGTYPTAVHMQELS
ncbi:unnamed protein product [Nippostrongylus brasiliensis]|uniref:DUF3124 domain-containing protein n=1 Tax=Nippostrongylus brasiliensis TaxID=27835 RepID=A0A0N4YW23_NIPBR|nr:unnamed protein product [Nippostrongylus brasiliensis]